MKKNFITYTCSRLILALIAVGISISSLAQGVGGQIIKTWDFEDESVGDWGPANGTGSVAIDDAHSIGAKALKFTTANTQAKAELGNDAFDALYSGDVLTFEIYISSDQAADIVSVQPFFQHNNWTGWEGNQVMIADLTTDAWNTISVTFPEDAGAVNRIGIQVEGGSDAGAPFIYVDNITIRSTVAQRWGFEDDNAGDWSAANGVGSVVVDGTQAIGTKSAQFTTSNTAAKAEFGNDVFEDFDPGDILVFEVYIPSDQAADIVSLQPFFQHSNWTGWEGNQVMIADLTTDEWNTISVTFPEEAGLVDRIGIQVEGGSVAGTPYVYIDDVKVVKPSLKNRWYFEDGEEGDWGPANGIGSVTIDDTHAIGTTALKFTTANTQAKAELGNDVFDSFDIKDVLSFEVYIPADQAADLKSIQPFIQHSNWAGWTGKQYLIEDLSVDGWNKVTVTYPEDAGAIDRIGLQIEGATDAGTPYVYVDNIRVDASLAILVESITITAADDATTIEEDDGTLQMSAAVLPADAENNSVAWSVDNVEGEAFIDENGLVTAYDDGKVIIKATSTDGSKVVGSYDLTISNQKIAVESVEVATEDGLLSLKDEGATLQFFGAVFPDKNVVDDSVLWSVSDESIATINKNGLLTAISNGDVQVIATSYQDAVVGTLDIAVHIDIKSIDISAESDAITNHGGTLQVNATVMPEKAADKSVTWRVLNESGRASIDESGILTAQGNGTVKVYAISNDGQIYSDTLSVSISGQYVPASAVSVWGEENVTSIESPGGTLQMHASVSPADASISDITWSVENGTGEASINDEGLLTALADGTVTVIATSLDSASVSPGQLVITISGQPLGLDDMVSIKLYPNPAFSTITLEGINQIRKLDLLTVGGKVIKTVEGLNTMDVKEIPGGTYLLQIHLEGNTVIKRIIKK